jgi:CubicO group peptidase (beta-lactamase class C family)
MEVTRREAILGLAALSLGGNAHAGEPQWRAAAAYSAARRGVSMIVLKAGRVMFEDYPNGGKQDSAWELASGTKSFTGVIAAAAAQDGMLALEETAALTLQEWRDDPRKSRITLHQLLSLESGLRPASIGRPPTYTRAIQAPAAVEPGSHFAYGPGPFQIFGEIMRRKLSATGRDPNPLSYLRARVLDPEGITVGLWRNGGDGNPMMPQGAALTVHNWAAFGQLVMEGGRGRVDRAALAQCFAPSVANPGYGMSWWLLRPGLIPPSSRMQIDAPLDLAQRFDVRMAAGAGDQRLYLIPPLDLVIARQASGILGAMLGLGGPRYSDADFLRLALGA